MLRFLITGHHACTDGDFSLNDLPGSGGRMDVLCRCVTSSLFLSHDLRRDVECYLVLAGDPHSPRTLLFRGSEIRYLSPDERSAGSLIKKALGTICGDLFRESSPGVYIRRGGLERLLREHPCAVLDEDGDDIRHAEFLPDVFVLSDHLDFTPDERELLAGLPAYSVGPRPLHADHAITVLLNEVDRRAEKWI